MSKEEIKHCPYCGGAAKVKYQSGYTWVECKKCKKGSEKFPDWGEERDPIAREMAIDDWNSLEAEGNQILWQ